MTMMVRDEADIVRAAIEHAIRQGVDRFIVTDNGSVDGTLEILQEYSKRGILDLRSDPVHRKQQSATVSAMARDAYSRYGADWVINADADEFWVAEAPGRTVREVLEETPKSYQAFLAPVIDMTGPPALAGGGVDRLRYRDNRSTEQLNRVGLRAHSTPDAVHIGAADVVVSQGNHMVSLASHGSPAPGQGLEVLHLPWRSWDQYRRKVENAGRAYESNPDAKPSPNHHGMREYQRLNDGTLLGHYIARHPDDAEIEGGLADGTFIADDRLAGVAEFGSPEKELPSAERAAAVDGLAPVLRAEAREFSVAGQLQVARSERDAALTEVEALRAVLSARDQTIDSYRRRLIVRATDAAARRARGVKQRGRGALRRVSSASAARAWRRSALEAWRGSYTLETLLGTPGNADMPVLMCLWNRAERIDEVLRQLDAQEPAGADARGIRLMLWNNQPADDAFYRSRIAEFAPSGALRSVEYVGSDTNIGGFARFVLARGLLRAGYRGHVITLDDDQDISPSFAGDLVAVAAPREISGWWAWNILDGYFIRTATPSGERADYVGTGGTIIDIDILRDEHFATDLPARYGFLEDQWLSAFARMRGWTLRKVDTPIEFVLHESNQFHALEDAKVAFQRDLDEQIARRGH